MRNVREYPITAKEAIFELTQTANQILLENSEQGLIGDMKPYVFHVLVEYLKLVGSDFDNFGIAYESR